MDLKVKTSTWVRTAVFAIAIVNQILTVLGYSVLPISEAMINETIVQVDLLISSLITIVVGINSWWYNNSFSRASREADLVLEEKKKEAKL